jgi:alpha-tubulin suppressor-like RCC1 family protein
LLCCVASCGRIGFAEIELRTDAIIGDPPLVGFTRLTAYGDQTCGTYVGRLYCWGRNASKQLGDGTAIDRPVPTLVKIPEGVVGAFTIGETHGCAVVNGKPHCWGEITNTQVFEVPTEIFVEGTVVDIAAGKRFTCLASAGKASCWGVNDVGQLGDGLLVNRDALAVIASSQGVIAVDAGDDHACALTTDNTALCWGHNDDGALGTGAFTPAMQETPGVVTNAIGTLPKIAGWHACTLLGTDVWCWGRNMEGALGDATTLRKAAPQIVPSFDSATFVATGGGPVDLDATCAIRGGDVYCWGAGTGGRLGNGSTSLLLAPTKVQGLPPNAIEVALGYAHTCAVFASADIWCWGRGDSGQLGDGAAQNSFTPVRVTPPPGS